VLPGCACTDPACCSTWFDKVESYLDIAHTAVEECSTSGCCGQYLKLITVAEPHYVQSYVGAWLVESLIVQPRQGGGNPKLLGFLPPKMTIGFKVMDAGWPSLETIGQAITVPAPEDLTASSRHSYAHAQSMLHAVVGAARGCGELQGIGGVRPSGPSGGLVGWTFTMQVQT
jgi:hypothetical protein